MANAQGRKAVTSAGTAERLQASDDFVSAVTIQAHHDNTGVMVLGFDATVVAAAGTRTGLALSAGDAFTVNRDRRHDPTFSLRDIWVDATVDGEVVTYIYMD